MSDLSDIVLNSEQKSNNHEPTSLVRKIWDVAKAAPVYAAGFALGGPAVLASMAIGGVAYSAAYSLEQKIAGRSVDWRGFYREFVTGSVLGGGSYGIFRYFSGIPGHDGASRLWKTAAYLGLASGVGVPFYRGIVYLREEVGFMNALKGLYNGSIKQYLKDAWNYDIKKNWAKLTFKSLAFAALPYHFIVNYIPNNIVQVAAQKAMTFVSRLIMGGKNLIKKPDEKTNNYFSPLRYSPNNSGTRSYPLASAGLS